MHVSKIVQHPHGHLVLIIIMEDYRRHSDAIISMICTRFQRSSCSSKRQCSEIAKILKHSIRDLKHYCAILKYCAFQQPKISELEATWLYCWLDLRALARFLALVLCAVLRAGLDSLCCL